MGVEVGAGFHSKVRYILVTSYHAVMLRTCVLCQVSISCMDNVWTSSKEKISHYVNLAYHITYTYANINSKQMLMLNTNKAHAWGLQAATSSRGRVPETSCTAQRSSHLLAQVQSRTTRPL